MSKTGVGELFEGSQWVIRGTVRKLAASTMPEAPVTAHSSVVRVNEILHGPSSFSDHIGRDITVYSEDLKGLAVGSNAVFFTRSSLYGRSLAVIEVGRLPNADRKTMAADIEGAQQAALERQLRERIANAALVVAGAVTETRPGPKLRRHAETEHAPDWGEALVKVHEVLKGKAPKEGIAVVFPRSLDELWIDSPKLAAGQTGVLILQRNQKEKGWPVLRTPGLTALDPLDFQPIEMLGRIREIIQTGGTK
jgi:hypothetical protein